MGNLRYEITHSYDWNYEHAPATPPSVDIPPIAGAWDFCGLPVNSPLGIPAGPLLNSRWILHYAALGFDVLTYKTVRSRSRASFDLPNLLHVASPPLDREGQSVEPASSGDTWAISFGMPSKDPAVWRADVELARKGLAKGQVLVVSVVASPEPDWTLAQVAEDFALCARWAAESGAEVVEPNLSCPNVCTKEASLYLSPEASGEIAAAVRAAVGNLPIALKAGLFQDRAQAAAFVKAVTPYANAISSTNSISAVVKGHFGGLRRGIGGAAITARCLEECRMLSAIIHEQNSPLKLIGAGGVMTARDVLDRMSAGAHHVQLATAPMLDPLIGVRLRQELNFIGYPNRLTRPLSVTR